MADRDPLYRQILERLSGELNGQTFEDAVSDLLRDTFPGLVPIRGGSDAGRDGAIADGEAEAFPLVVTTEVDVIGNLTKSLDSYLRDGGRRRKAVLATSQELTPQRRRNLEQRANEKGFDLVQVIERRGIADRLYRDAGWRSKLLRLSGTPSALSAVPPSKRPFLELAPVGRDEDLAWLRTTTGDRVLSGQPGSGKTFLLQHLIREGWPGLFLVSREETEIADALRAQEPGFVVIVDDAHTDPDVLVRLRRLRLEIGAEFSILATTWERNLDSVIEALGYPTATRELELLTRPQILEIYRQAGITEENTDRDLIRDLVDQASNRPGLAATLALLWLRGAGREVLTGQALSQHVRETFRSVIGDAAPLLAAFSLGGDRGMPLSSVAEIYRLSLAELWRQTVDLAAGGALCQVEREVLAVRPHQLRSALIGTVFFPDPGHGPALPYQPFLDRAPSFGSAVEALVRARNYGVPVPDDDLRKLVSRADALDPWWIATENEPGLEEFILHSDVLAAWKGLTLSSEENARWVLEHYPGETLHLAHEALLSSPQAILPRLLARASEFRASFNSYWGHPLRILERWIREPLAAPQESMRRRWLLTQEIVRYLRGGDPAVGLQALTLALSPKLETSSLDPGIGNVVLLEWGVLPESVLPELGNLWAAVREEFSSLPLEGWPSLAQVLWEWIEPEHIAPEGTVSEEARRILHNLAVSVIRDLVPRVRTSPGIISALRRFAERLGLPDDSLPLDPVFEILFPEPDFEALPEPDMADLNELAENWSRNSPEDVVRQLANYEHEARQIDRRWPRHTPQVCRELAARIDTPVDWLNAFFEQSLPGDLAEPFLQAVLSLRPEGWEPLLERWLGSETWERTVASLLARVTDLPEDLAEKTLARLEADPRLTYILALRNEICFPLLRVLFLSSTPETALAAAVGAWLAHPRSIPQDLADAWRNAVLRAGTEIDDRSLLSSLAQVLAADSALAFDWLRARIQTGSIPSGLSLSSAEKRPFLVALSLLDMTQRSTLLAELAPSPNVKEFLPHLIGKNIALYRQLLEREDLREYQLAPLQGTPDPEWIPLAMAAAESGWVDREIARETLWGMPVHSFWGSGVEHWSRWKESFATLEANPHEEIRAIARAGQELVKPLIEKALREERKTALHGL